MGKFGIVMTTARKTAVKTTTSAHTNKATKTVANTSSGKDATMATKNTKTAAETTEVEKKTDGRSNPTRLSPQERKERDLNGALKSYNTKKAVTDKLQAKADASRAILDELEKKVRAYAFIAGVDADEVLGGAEVFEDEAPNADAEAQFAVAEVVED